MRGARRTDRGIFSAREAVVRRPEGSEKHRKWRSLRLLAELLEAAVQHTFDCDLMHLGHAGQRGRSRLIIQELSWLAPIQLPLPVL